MIDDILLTYNFYSGINKINTTPSITVSPNPTSDFISIETDNNSEFKSATITDIVGKTILTTDHTKINLSHLEAGIYFVTINTDKGKYIKRILKEKGGTY